MTLPCPLSGTAIDALPPEVQRRLVGILERYLEDLERGISPDTEELVRQHPDLAEPLREYFKSIDFVHEATSGIRGSEKVSAAPPDPSKRQLGDYLIVREIGRGGMGVVYEARQISLDRQVALKVLPFAAVLDQRQIARFHNEAQAAAQLHHPNIVPVFAVGCDRGVHYYAMQYIEGQPLDRAIRGLRQLNDELVEGKPRVEGRELGEESRLSTLDPRPSTDQSHGQEKEGTKAGISQTWRSFSDAASLRSGPYFRTVAQMGVEAAEALEHAHQMGIVHRDVKPSNLLLDAQGKVWITDFGLARFPANSNLTVSGDVMGTIRYMSPEQVSGKPGLIDHRTDVYSLGITLYELATLHEAFEGADRQAFLRWITEEEPRPPRRLNPAIPMDLETILLKAIAKSPQDRYATAQEFADDLRHFLEGEPVLARRAGWMDRAGKWAKRHKTLVAAALVLLMIVLAGSIASALLLTAEHAKTKTALAQAEINLQQSEKNLRRAEEHFKQLREVVDRFGAYHAERLKDLPGAEPLRRELLLNTLNYYRGFIRYAADDPTLQTDLAATYSKAAGVSDQIGDKPAALDAYRRAEGILKKLADDQPDTPRRRVELALCRNNVGLLLAAMGKPSEAESAYREALAIQKKLADGHPDNAEFQSDLALIYNNLGLLENSTNHKPEAERSCREAIRLQQQLADKFPNRPDYRHSLAVSYNNLSFIRVKADPLNAGEASRKARAIQEKLVAQQPDNMEYQSDLALSCNNLGALENYNGHPDRAEAAYRRAIALQEQLVRKAPSVVRFRRDLAISQNNLGSMYSKSDRPKEAEKAFNAARATMQELVDDYPEDLSSHSSLGGIFYNLGMALEQLGRREDAAAMYARAIEQQRYAYEHAPQVAQYREFLDKHYDRYRRALKALNRTEDYNKATEAQQKLLKELTNPPK